MPVLFLWRRFFPKTATGLALLFLFSTPLRRGGIVESDPGEIFARHLLARAFAVCDIVRRMRLAIQTAGHHLATTLNSFRVRREFRWFLHARDAHAAVGMEQSRGVHRYRRLGSAGFRRRRRGGRAGRARNGRRRHKSDVRSCLLRRFGQRRLGRRGVEQTHLDASAIGRRGDSHQVIQPDRRDPMQQHGRRDCSGARRRRRTRQPRSGTPPRAGANLLPNAFRGRFRCAVHPYRSAPAAVAGQCGRTIASPARTVD